MRLDKYTKEESPPLFGLKTNGTLWGELRYSAWGETRYSNGTIVTDRQFTEQVNDGDTGLYYYNARYYDPALHRFIQADTIVPDPNKRAE